MLISSCGGNSIKLEVLLSVNQTDNALLQVSQDLQSGLSTGIFFILDELDPAPTSIDDLKVGGASISDPNLASSVVGLDPLTNEFKISTTALLPGTFYRIKMIARAVDGTTTHTGTGDCPIKLSLESQNMVHICFGKNLPSNPPLCPGLTSFSDCPGL